MSILNRRFLQHKTSSVLKERQVELFGKYSNSEMWSNIGNICACSFAEKIINSAELAVSKLTHFQLTAEKHDGQGEEVCRSEEPQISPRDGSVNRLRN